MSEFNLSLHEFPEGFFPKDKVKEFIKKLKEKFSHYNYSWINETIDETAGDKLK